MPKNDEAKQLVEAKLPDDVVIVLDGQAFSFPRDQDDWPTGAIVAAGRVSTGRAQYDEVVECLLGEDQWARLKLLPFRSFKDFLKLFSEAMDDINN